MHLLSLIIAVPDILLYSIMFVFVVLSLFLVEPAECVVGVDDVIMDFKLTFVKVGFIVFSWCCRY